MIKLNESSNNKHKLITIDVWDQDDDFEKMINYIRDNANVGHSFPIEVDPHDNERKSSFYMDGDGSFRINSIEVKVESDKD